ncbi:DinB superfamily protein [Marininema mesophilum]|uniref:DinB superfamily protein n=1 Tax=Marininema mesophilum TaxID=1048340 RepID=A0A1H2WNV3_9BACL|nr:DinB family protein [Marininema mesophilum]SDW82312.1 DinB superfamily protein [Marininema mesophilum]
MNAIDLIIHNFEETRRRSIITWRGISDQYLDWRPDKDAYSFGETIRHTWVGDHEYMYMLKTNGQRLEEVPFEKVPILSVEQEIAYSLPYRQELIDWIHSLSPIDLAEKSIEREKGHKRTLGDMLLRIAYHDSVHVGYLMQYMRTLQIARPDIWD